MIHWTKENKEKLTLGYNSGKTDSQMTDLFVRAGTYAIGKQRSVMGLVERKHPGMHRKPKSVVTEVNEMFYVAHYQKDDVNHFSRLDTDDEEKAKELIRALMSKRNLDSVILLCPKTKLVIQKATEIVL